MTENDDKPLPQKRRGGGGKARMKQIAAQAQDDRKALEAELISDLGRPATALDRIAIESIAAAAIRGRQLRAQGHDDLDQQRLIAQLLRATGLRPEKPVPTKQEEDFGAEMQRMAMPAPSSADESKSE